MSPALQEALHKSKDDIRKIRVAGTKEAKSPHQFVLLLTLVDLFERAPTRENRFLFGADLKTAFLNTWGTYLNSTPDYPENALDYPYYHLSTSRLWILTPRPETRDKFQTYSDPKNKMRFTANRIKETIEYAAARGDLEMVLRDSEARADLRTFLIELVNKALANNQDIPSVPSSSRFEHERQAIQTILDRVRSSGLGRCIPNYEVFDSSSNDYYECDIIVVSAFGVFVTELKHWTGRIEVGPRSWRINNSQHRPDPHASNRFKSKILRGIYQHAFPTLPDLWFESVVVLTNPEANVVNASPVNTDQHNPTFASIDRFIDFLKHRQAQAAGRTLYPEQVKAVATKFESLRVLDHVKGYNFPGYEVVDPAIGQRGMSAGHLRTTAAGVSKSMIA